MRPTARIRLAPRTVGYGWWVATAGCAAMTVTSLPTFQGSSVIFAAIENHFGWSRTVVSAAASLGSLVYLIMAPVQGWLADRYGPARVMLAGLLVGALGLALFSRVTNPPVYFAAWLVLSLGTGVGGFTPAMTAVNAWLPRYRATGMAIVMTGTSIAALLVPALAWGITSHGWRNTSLVLAVIFAAAAPVLAKVVARRAPAVLVADASSLAAARAQPSPSTGFTPVQALRTWSFWTIALSHAFANLAVAAVSTHVVLHLTDIGISFAAAAAVVPVFGGVAFAAQIAGGLLGDRIDKRLGSAVMIVIQAVSMAVLAFTTAYAAAILFALLYGIGFGARTPMMHALRGEYFGARSFGTILGLEAIPMSIGMMASPVIVGWAFDVQHTYRTAFIALAAASAVAAVLILLARPPAQPEPSRSP